MKRADLQELEAEAMDLLVQRRRLGGFDTHADTIVKMLETQLKIIRHLEEKEPRPKPKKTDEEE